MAESLLSDLKPGQTGRIQRIDAPTTVKQRLQEMGLIRGTAVTFVRAAPLGGPVEIRVRGYHLSLRRTEAEQIILEGDSA